MNLQQQVRATREAGHVRRCHNLPHLGYYDVAQHCWQAVALLFHLHPDPRPDLIWALAFHDTGERFFGDQPSPVSRSMPQLKNSQRVAEALARTKMGVLIDLNDEDDWWLRSLDALEFLMWAEDQLNFGNRHIVNALGTTRVWFRENWDQVPKPIQDFYSTYEWGRGDEHLS